MTKIIELNPRDIQISELTDWLRYIRRSKMYDCETLIELLVRSARFARAVLLIKKRERANRKIEKTLSKLCHQEAVLLLRKEMDQMGLYFS